LTGAGFGTPQTPPVGRGRPHPARRIYGAVTVDALPN
jgi:hypothetical protein